MEHFLHSSNQYLLPLLDACHLHTRSPSFRDNLMSVFQIYFVIFQTFIRAGVLYRASTGSLTTQSTNNLGASQGYVFLIFYQFRQ